MCEDELIFTKLCWRKNCGDVKFLNRRGKSSHEPQWIIICMRTLGLVTQKIWSRVWTPCFYAKSKAATSAIRYDLVVGCALVDGEG